MRKALSILISVSIALAPVGPVSAGEESRRIVDAYFERYADEPLRLQQLAASVFSSAKLEAESLKFAGDTVKIPATAKRVKGHNPPCHNNQSPRDQTAKALKDFGLWLSKSSIIFFPAEPTGTMTGILFLTGAVISGFGTLLGAKTFQEEANCALACAALPGTYQRDDLKKLINVSYTYNRGAGAADRPIEPLDDGDWFVASDWTSSNLELKVRRSEQSALFESLLIKQGNGTYTPIPRDNQEIACPTTLVCSQAKNWSATLQRTLLVTVLADIRQISSGSCLDASLVNRTRYSDVRIEKVPTDFIPEYYSALKEREIARRSKP